MPSSQYYLLTFESFEEAAAFVAALSRFLNSPRANFEAETIEVWCALASPQVKLYLSDAAKNAAAQAFAPLPATSVCTSDDFAAPSRLILGPIPVPAWGAAEAEHALSAVS